MPKADSDTAVEILLLALLATLWGASYALIRVGVATIPPLAFIAARTLIAGGLLVAALRLRGFALPRDAATWRAFSVQATLNCVLPYALIAWAERDLEADLATILNATSPAFAFLFAMALARGERVPARKLAGVAMGLAGTCLVVGVDAFRHVGLSIGPELAVVLASAAYGGAALFGRKFRSLDPLLPAAGSMVCGAAVLVPVSLVVESPWRAAPSAASLAALLALSTLSTALAFTIYFRLIRTLGAVATTAQAYLRVPIGVGIGVLTLGERPGPTALAGLALVVTGVALMSAPARRPTILPRPHVP